ncbi:MAG: hypothetical protein J4224_01280 [Candidatus Diapherotrites archaeon]|uniref:Uncharacterized protein n=1 Tax=Candidatus Iainarchaeum sp. TaxID=3101447 RepID=A0A7J4IVU3_9ARCH|nr:MAG: hypothetical protein QT03_C0001G1336 [archaeon GW2011_AR10]MBS3059037.1 hypothetical protein [Candidatus Diapherotrites archaeon]HIH08894.1 hypothetical protein [Candidatus Diapherotrites archaeon]
MNLPVGDIIKQGIKLKEFDSRIIESFYDKEFSGYLVASIEGYAGIEEGALLFKKGLLIGAFYEYLNYGITVHGNQAVQQVFNSLAAEYGVIDVISLTNQQADLITAFNDKIKLTVNVGKKDVRKLSRSFYSNEFAEKVLSKVLEKHESRKNVFKKLGLTDLGG